MSDFPFKSEAHRADHLKHCAEVEARFAARLVALKKAEVESAKWAAKFAVRPVPMSKEVLEAFLAGLKARSAELTPEKVRHLLGC
jgi:hypothetical protein